MITSSTFNDSLASTGGTSVLSTSQAKYGDNQFLTLLTEQLRNQTPLDPVDNESFMSQMASYTTMEEQRELNSNLLKLLDYQGVLARLQGLSEGSALLGKDVSYVDADGNEQTARVESVYVAENGDVRLRLSGDAEIGLREVIGVSQPEAGGAPQPGTPNSGAGNGAGSTGGSGSSSGGSGSGGSGGGAGSGGSGGGGGGGGGAGGTSSTETGAVPTPVTGPRQILNPAAPTRTPSSVASPHTSRT
jgi:hypothetical protein